MSVNPLDLQTLFSHIDIAARNYSHQKEAAIHAQGIIGRHVVEESIHKEHAVNDVQEMHEESMPIKEDEEPEQKRDNEAYMMQQKKAEQESDYHPFRNSDDPLYASRVDISG